MKTDNIYTKVILSIWYFVKKASIAIVSAVPNQKIRPTELRKSKLYFLDEDFKDDKEKHHHRPISKPVVEKQTLLKEAKKQKGYRP
jgi:hypothetical protein